MSGAAILIPPDPSPEPVFRLSVAQYHAMIDTGVLTPDDPVELLEGILVFKVPKKPAHRIALAKIKRAIESRLTPTLSLQLQEPITLIDGEPEPDGTVYRGQAEDYPDRHTGPEDIRLVIEVADSTLARDRGIKLRSYARAGLSPYWIVALGEGTVEVYTEPDADAAVPGYRRRRAFDRTSNVPFEIAGEALPAIAVDEILP